jgi:hypothetical protein
VEVKVAPGDARSLTRVRDGRVGLIVASPPYPGVYDYHVHHAVRLRWLGLEEERFERFEIGARRRARGRTFEAALAAWQRELGACLGEMNRVLTKTGGAALVIADSALAGRAFRADAITAELAAVAGLRVVARASQERPNFHLPSQAAFRDAPRREHLMFLRRSR